jgi:5-methylcytosine-specific restriction endonuclease McrA
MSGVVVLNASYEPLGVVSLHRAMVYVIRERVQVVQAVEGATFRSADAEFPVPKVVAFKHQIRVPYRRRQQAWSTRGVIARDAALHSGLCAYCGKRPGTTVDHIVPASTFTPRSAANTWMNTIAACNMCNNRKANRTPEEAGMPLRYQPREVFEYDRLLVAIQATGADLVELGLAG